MLVSPNSSATMILGKPIIPIATKPKLKAAQIQSLYPVPVRKDAVPTSSVMWKRVLHNGEKRNVVLCPTSCGGTLAAFAYSHPRTKLTHEYMKQLKHSGSKY